LSNVLEDDPGTGTADAEAPKESVRGYRPELDVVRFIAFLLVFFHHVFYPLFSTVFSGKPSPSDNISLSTARILNAYANSCGMGMCLFFCLSAYLITEILLQERQAAGAISVRRFYLRRILRIWPLYLFGIFIGIAWAALIVSRQQMIGFVWYLLFAGNIFCTYGWWNNPMALLWSISVEEQFYLIWPWAMRWFSRRGLLWCALFFIIVANITLFNLGQHHANTDWEVWCNTLVQFEMFATGILLALTRKRFQHSSVLAGVILAVSGPVIWFFACYLFNIKGNGSSAIAISGIYLMIGYAMIALGCAAVLHGFCMIGPSYMPRWVTGLGKISYGLYVYHYLAIQLSLVFFISLHIPHASLFSVFLALALTILAAKLSYSRLESPFLRLKRRFEIVHSRPI
jgi:peptidoglycan/LPS O-acetylase OafA/YrhL